MIMQPKHSFVPKLGAAMCAVICSCAFSFADEGPVGDWNLTAEFGGRTNESTFAQQARIAKRSQPSTPAQTVGPEQSLAQWVGRSIGHAGNPPSDEDVAFKHALVGGCAKPKAHTIGGISPVQHRPKPPQSPRNTSTNVDLF